MTGLPAWLEPSRLELLAKGAGVTPVEFEPPRPLPPSWEGGRSSACHVTRGS
jgi:hypothetical protein